MTTHLYTPTLRLTGPYAATIGFFDGLHQGHAHLLRQLQSIAADRHLQTLIVTFDRHPRQTLQPDFRPQLLTTLDEKQQLLAQAGIDVLVVLPFDADLARLSAHDFMSQVLCDHLGVTTLLTGYDNRFGARTAQNPDIAPFVDYQSYGATIGIDVLLAEPFYLGGDTVSSSRIRRLLADGLVADAAQCLGHPYTLSGIVVHGEQIGRTLGFPTANIQPDDPLKLIPKSGVYAVTILPSPLTTHHSPSLMNIGTRPTFDGHALTLEAHLLDFTGDLYGQHLQVTFIERLRDEQSFPSSEALTRQMHLDADAARRIFTTTPIS